MRERRAQQKLIALAVGVASLLVLQQPAQAHYVYESEIMWQGPGGYCVTDRAEISDGINMEGYTDTRTSTFKPIFLPFFFPCTLSWTVPAGRLAANTQLWVYDYKYDMRWEVCSIMPWLYNSMFSDDRIDQAKYWGPKCSSNWGNDGQAWYMDFGTSYVWANEGQGYTWLGGGQFSGMHLLNAFPN